MGFTGIISPKKISEVSLAPTDVTGWPVCPPGIRVEKLEQLEEIE